MEPENKTDKSRILIGVLLIILAITLFNTYQLSAFTIGGFVAAQDLKNSPTKNLASSVIPSGIPEVYGDELSISFDDVNPLDPYLADQIIEVLKNLDVTLSLSGEDLDRYINILYTMEKGMSCEYCCGAQSVIFADGKAACGCAHSYAMRGLTKYLITEHGDEFTDEEILEEVGKWKTLFFPTQMQKKAEILAEQDIEFNYINLASNKYRGLEKGVSGGMVGGC